MRRWATGGLWLTLACSRGDARQEAVPADTLPPRYATDFAATEAPISDGGQWLNGGTDGGDWTDVSSTGGRAIGHQTGASYTDATAVLTGTWGPDQSASATVFASGPRPDKCKSEVELRLRSTIGRHDNRGYEITFSVSQENPYLLIARWNGQLGDFTVLLNPYGEQYRVGNGDVIKATVVGNRITAYKNGVVMGRVTDDAFSSGTPGLGFNLENSRAGCPGTNGEYGFSHFSATEVAAR